MTDLLFDAIPLVSKKKTFSFRFLVPRGIFHISRSHMFGFSIHVQRSGLDNLFVYFFFFHFFYFFVFFQFYLRFLALFRLFSILFPFFWLFFVFLTFFLFYSLIFHFFFLKKENFPTLTFWLTLFLPLIHFPSHSIIRKMRYPFHSLFLARQNRGRPLFTCISTIFGGFSVHLCGFSFAPSWQMTGNHDTCQMIISIIHIYATLKCFLSFSWIHPAMYNIDKSLKRPKNVPIMKKHILCCNECRHCEGKLIP